MSKTTTLDQIESFEITATLIDIALDTLLDSKVAIILALKELENVECPTDPERHRNNIQSYLATSLDAVASAQTAATLTRIFADQGKAQS